MHGHESCRLATHWLFGSYSAIRVADLPHTVIMAHTRQRELHTCHTDCLAHTRPWELQTCHTHWLQSCLFRLTEASSVFAEKLLMMATLLDPRCQDCLMTTEVRQRAYNWIADEVMMRAKDQANEIPPKSVAVEASQLIATPLMVWCVFDLVIQWSQLQAEDANAAPVTPVDARASRASVMQMICMYVYLSPRLIVRVIHWWSGLRMAIRIASKSWLPMLDSYLARRQPMSPVSVS